MSRGLSRLDEFGIRLMVEGPVSIYVRGDCIAAVGATQGSTGMMTPQGLAYLVWRDGQALLAAKGTEAPATAGQVEAIRKFSEDLKAALDQ